jgi:hypothetical protein
MAMKDDFKLEPDDTIRRGDYTSMVMALRDTAAYNPPRLSGMSYSESEQETLHQQHKRLQGMLGALVRRLKTENETHGFAANGLRWQEMERLRDEVIAEQLPMREQLKTQEDAASHFAMTMRSVFQTTLIATQPDRVAEYADAIAGQIIDVAQNSRDPSRLAAFHMLLRADTHWQKVTPEETAHDRMQHQVARRLLDYFKVGVGTSLIEMGEDPDSRNYQRQLQKEAELKLRAIATDYGFDPALVTTLSKWQGQSPE